MAHKKQGLQLILLFSRQGAAKPLRANTLRPSVPDRPIKALAREKRYQRHIPQCDLFRLCFRLAMQLDKFLIDGQSVETRPVQGTKRFKEFQRIDLFENRGISGQRGGCVKHPGTSAVGLFALPEMGGRSRYRGKSDRSRLPPPGEALPDECCV